MSLKLSISPLPEYLTQAEKLKNNDGQWKAYESLGSCVVLAGPGSGKTKTLTLKVARMLNEDIRPPRGLACLTYSNECAREIRKRLEDLGVEERHNVFIGTVHAFCLNHVILPYARLAGIDLPESIKVVNTTDANKFLRSSLQTLNVTVDFRTINARMQNYRRTRLDRGGDDWERDKLTVAIIKGYEGLLRANGVIDFEDMALIGFRLIEEHDWIRRALYARFPILVVDEYQDLGEPLHRIVMQLCFRQGARLFAVGDPEQSVYGFTGAKPELLLQLARRTDLSSVELKLNYRCGRRIVAGSLAVLQETHDYEAANDYEGIIDFHEVSGNLTAQAEYICKEIIPSILSKQENYSLGDIAVLYSNYRDAKAITTSVKNSDYKYTGGDKEVRYRSTQLTRWIEDCAAWCAGGGQTKRLRLSSLIRYWLYLHGQKAATDKVLLRRRFTEFLWLNRQPRKSLMTWFDELKMLGLSSAIHSNLLLADEAESLEEISEAINDANRVGGYNLQEFGALRGSKNHLNLFTLHSSKGLEFEVVIMMNMNKDQIPRAGATPIDIAQARRVFYVGLTRAKHEVHIVHSGSYSQSNVEFSNSPSDFVVELQRNLEPPNR